MYLKSMQVAQQLGINYWRLVYLLRSDKIAQPKKDASGDLIWSARDVQKVRKVLELNDGRPTKYATLAVPQKAELRSRGNCSQSKKAS